MTGLGLLLGFGVGGPLLLLSLFMALALPRRQEPRRYPGPKRCTGPDCVWCSVHRREFP